MGKTRRRKTKRKMPGNDTELHIPSAIVRMYLVPLIKMCLFLWLVITGKIIAGCAIYLLFGLSKLHTHMKNMSSIDNWIVNIMVYGLLWPALDIYAFIPPSNTDLE